MKIVAVTACPTGIAHTYMAAEALEQAAAAAGHEIAVETQGSAGFDPLPPETIAAADAVIFAVDVDVRGRERFAGLPVVQSGVKRAINDGPGMIAQAEAAAAAGDVRVPAQTAGVATSTAAGPATKVTQDGHLGTRLRQWLMTGVSYVIPFVAAGGLLIALSFAIGGYEIVNQPPPIEVVDGKLVDHAFSLLSGQDWAALMFWVGKWSFSFLVPVLAGFIAYAMADRPALVPGFVGGYISTLIGAGFLGGLVAGLLAGTVVLAILRVRVPKAVRGIMPVVVIPLVSTLVVGFLMYVVVGKPISSATSALTDWLNGLSGTNAIVLGALLGLMMAFDMGGPVNKVAYSFAVAGLSTGSDGSLKVMAAVMAAGMTPPLGLALATTLRRKLFTEAELENGRAAWVLGASFITEGAIPFAAADPLRVIPSLMAGSAATGALSMAFDATLRAPHGGIFVVGLVGNAFLYLVAIAVGTAITAGCVIALKQLGRPAEAAAEVEAVVVPQAAAARA